MLDCNMSTKLYFFNNQLANFSKNLDAVIDEQDERFHQDLKVI